MACIYANHRMGFGIGLVAFLTVGIATPQSNRISMLPAEHIKQLIAEREFENEQLRFHERMLAASSFADRTDLFCTDAADAALANQHLAFAAESYGPSAAGDLGAELRERMMESQEAEQRKTLLNSIPHGPYGLTLDDLRNTYRELNRDKPTSREGEVLRQQKLIAINHAVTDYRRELSACRTAVTYGKRDAFGVIPPFQLPTDDALRTDAKQERNRIAEIDQELHKLQGKQ